MCWVYNLVPFSGLSERLVDSNKIEKQKCYIFSISMFNWSPFYTDVKIAHLGLSMTSS